MNLVQYFLLRSANIFLYHYHLIIAKEKLPLTEADKTLASAIKELTTQNTGERKSYLADPEMRAEYLKNIKTLAEQKATIANQVLELLK